MAAWLREAAPSDEPFEGGQYEGHGKEDLEDRSRDRDRSIVVWVREGERLGLGIGVEVAVAVG